MEIQYQNTRSDFKVAYENFMQHGKTAQRSEFYYGVLWCIAVLALASSIAIKNGEIFATCVFVALGGFYLKHNWSFARRWEAAADSYAATSPESSCTMVVDEHGLTERFSGVELKISWPTIHDYAILEDRLFINSLPNRAFIIPFRHLSATQRDELMKTLEQHNVRQRE